MNGQAEPFDRGNQLISEQPGQLLVGRAGLPQGQRLVLTIRTPTTTLTLLLSKADALAWGKQVTDEAGKMSGLIVAGNGSVPPASGKGPGQ